jgi:hypothetical protein
VASRLDLNRTPCEAALHFDWDMVKLEKLCMLHCTDREIASYLGVSVESIEQGRQSPAFVAVMEWGVNGKVVTRRFHYE